MVERVVPAPLTCQRPMIPDSSKAGLVPDIVALNVAHRSTVRERISQRGHSCLRLVDPRMPPAASLGQSRVKAAGRLAHDRLDGLRGHPQLPAGNTRGN